MKASDIIRSIINFLFSKANREFLIFLFFFAVAGVFWILMALNDNYEQEIRIPVHYTNIPKTVVMTSPETDTLRVTIRDKGIILLGYMYGDAMQNITIDFKSNARHNGMGEVPASELSKKITSRLTSSSKLISIKPEKLTFYYNYGEKKRVPIKWRGSVTPEELFFISGVEYDPDSVTIYASHPKLDSINTVYTEVLNCSDFRDTLTVDARLQKIAGVKMLPNMVSIRFMTDVLTEVSFDDVPVVGINMPKGKILRTFPAKVKVKFVTGVKTYQSLSKNDFRVVADYEEIQRSQSSKCNIYLQSSPEGITRAALSVKQVDYLIEEQSQKNESTDAASADSIAVHHDERQQSVNDNDSIQ